MTGSRGFTCLFALTLVLLAFTGAARADKSAVTLDVPASAAPGATVTVTVHVIHEGNNYFHFTDWVFLRAGDLEIARWTFTPENRPENETFSRQVDFTVTDTLVFSAQANCNVHGSAGPASSTVRVGAENPGPAPARPAAAPAMSDGGWGATAVLALGIANFLLILFQVASGRRWIRVKIAVHRRAGQALLVLAAAHGLLAILIQR